MSRSRLPQETVLPRLSAPSPDPPYTRTLRWGRGLAVIGLACACSLACSDAVDPAPNVDTEAPERARAGGDLTVVDATSNAFSLPAPNLSGARLELHLEGSRAFEQTFVQTPSAVSPGLGPLFNAPSCERCHIREGRSRDGALVRLSVDGGVDGVGSDGGPVPVPGFGRQLQDRAVFGVAPEGRFLLTWREIPGEYGDGSPYSLREPALSIVDTHQPLPAVFTSVRMSRPVFGLGLLEAVSEVTLLALEDVDDRDGDGISGKRNKVRRDSDRRFVSGRFGWKANEALLDKQVATAYQEDMGITSSLLPAETTAGQLGQHDGLADDPELDDDVLAAVTFYMQTLAVPAPRRLDDPAVIEGERLFSEIGCAGCHVPRLETGVLDGVPEVSNQVIYPYTDLLVHDVGPGLEDGRVDWFATSSEWRTPPLWGLGLSRVVNGHMDLLHDGRARTIAEAILWHGGEAEPSRERFRLLAGSARDALIAFLESL